MSMNDAILAVAQAQQQGDAIPVDVPPMTQSAPDMDKPPATPKTKTDTMEEPRLWPEIKMMLESWIRDQPRERQPEIGPSELGTDCLHCLAAKLAGWSQSRKTSWLAFIGTCVHARFEEWFNADQQTISDVINAENLIERHLDDMRRLKRFQAEMRVKVGSLSGLYGGTELHGSIDLYDRKTHSTVDWKITGDTTMRAAKANGPSQQYRVQASLYGIGLENAGEKCERNCIFMLPRNKTSLDDAYAWEVPFDQKPGRWAMSRAQLLINLMDCIELADGLEVRDAWIHSLPTSPTHCFQCGSWPDDQLGELSELNASMYPDVPAKWETLKQLLQPTYEG